jgi:hypothetical protein
MTLYLNILNFAESLLAISDSVKESWGFMEIHGKYNDNACSTISQLNTLLKNSNCDQVITIKIDKAVVTKEELEEFAQSKNSYQEWQVNFNKQSLVERKLDNNFHYNFFLRSSNCQEWLNGINPIEETNPLNKFNPLKIIIKDLKISFGGEHLYFLPAEEKFSQVIHKNPLRLPKIERIKENVHFITDFSVSFDPNVYIITEGDYSSAISQCLLKQSSIVLASCMVNEFYGFDSIVIDGLKRITLKLTEDGLDFNFDFNQKLINLLHWMYEDRVSTRKKLFNERLTLELNEKESFIKSLQLFTDISLSQARERFNFVILDRKDAYIKELKELLKDLRNQSDLYSQKIRTLLSNCLRDALAAIVLIGFTIFTKFTDNLGLDNHMLLKYVFYALGIYYIASIILQAVVDCTDMGITNSELKYWKNASKELIPEREFNQHLNESLKSRRWSLKILYPIIGLLYLSMAFVCFKYPDFFEQLMIKK